MSAKTHKMAVNISIKNRTFNTLDEVSKSDFDPKMWEALIKDSSIVPLAQEIVAERIAKAKKEASLEIKGLSKELESAFKEMQEKIEELTLDVEGLHNKLEDARTDIDTSDFVKLLEQLKAKKEEIDETIGHLATEKAELTEIIKTIQTEKEELELLLEEIASKPVEEQ